MTKSCKRRTVFVLIDGLGDVNIACIENQTPLAYAKTPNLDSLAANGVCGLMDPVQVGLACGSDTAHLSIFGFDPRVYYRGRGAFETMGSGLHMDVGDIGFKCNFALYDPDTGIVLKRRADREFGTWGRSLCDYLSEHIELCDFPRHKVTFQYATEHRCGVRIQGPGLSDEISDTDPLKDNLPLKTSVPLTFSTEAQQTAILVNQLSKAIHEALEAHPLIIERRKRGLTYTNIVLFRGCGRRIEVTSFREKFDTLFGYAVGSCIGCYGRLQYGSSFESSYLCRVDEKRRL
ncbi:2,3-bisphosphoglycerate-independent phosphoglycerate mutase [Galdieria sulphuraria]|nr:2,3-bisphosphoglycerate-independent phosphoglycerate mutase [Galdieria sulphuraria]